MKVVKDSTRDAGLVAGLKQGDRLALKKIYQLFFPPICGFVQKHGGNEEDAKDIFQEGVMVVYRMSQKPDFSLTGSFLSLLYPICRNLWYKAVRKRPYYQQVEEMEVSQEPEIEKTIRNRAIDDLFEKKMDALPSPCKELLTYFFEGVSMKEIVLKMRLSSVSFAKKKKFQCKEKLVTLIQADPLFDELKIQP